MSKSGVPFDRKDKKGSNKYKCVQKMKINCNNSVTQM